MGPSGPPEDGVPPTGSGVLAGTVTRGPLSGVGGIGASGSSAPVAGARIIASRSGGAAEAKSTSTNTAGQYRVFLPSGTYLVTLDRVDNYLFTKDLPASVTVAEGQTTTLNVLLDTGIR